MSNPTTGEWTSKSVWNLLDEGGGEMVAAAHNSTLTSAREYAVKYTKELREQLSAERMLSKWLPKGTDKLLEALQAASDFMDYLRANTGVSDEWPIEFKVAPDAVDQVNKLLNDFESKVYAITKPK